MGYSEYSRRSVGRAAPALAHSPRRRRRHSARTCAGSAWAAPGRSYADTPGRAGLAEYSQGTPKLRAGPGLRSTHGVLAGGWRRCARAVEEVVVPQVVVPAAARRVRIVEVAAPLQSIAASRRCKMDTSQRCNIATLQHRYVGSRRCNIATSRRCNTQNARAKQTTQPATRSKRRAASDEQHATSSAHRERRRHSLQTRTRS
jgi:hypothetical protein